MRRSFARACSAARQFTPPEGPFPEQTRRLALDSDATLLGAVGLPEFDNLPPFERPEKGLLGIRKALDGYGNRSTATRA